MRTVLTSVLATTLAAAASAQAPTKGWRAEFLNSMSGAERKYVALAEAVPWEKYAWRPAQGVRSICEVYLHMAGANYLFSEPLGTKTPATVNMKTIETCPANKSQVVETLKASFAHLKNAVNATSEGDADAATSIFGMNMTKRGLFLMAAEHAGEHLGQSIAYARTNGVVPPWSARAGN